MNEMKACDHLPTHLGRGALHTRRPPPRHVSLVAPSKRYPGKQENVSESPTPKWKPILLLKAGTPGSSQGSRSYSGTWRDRVHWWGPGQTLKNNLAGRKSAIILKINQYIFPRLYCDCPMGFFFFLFCTTSSLMENGMNCFQKKRYIIL